MLVRSLKKGHTLQNRTSNIAVIDERTQMEIYYPPFEAAVKAGVGSVMCSCERLAAVPQFQPLCTCTLFYLRLSCNLHQSFGAFQCGKTARVSRLVLLLLPLLPLSLLPPPLVLLPVFRQQDCSGWSAVSQLVPVEL